MKLTVVSVMRQLALQQLKAHEELHSNFIRAQELSTSLERAGELLSEPLSHAKLLNGAQER